VIGRSSGGADCYRTGNRSNIGVRCFPFPAITGPAAAGAFPQATLLIDFELAKLLRLRCRSDALAKAFPCPLATRMFLEAEKCRSRSLSDDQSNLHEVQRKMFSCPVQPSPHFSQVRKTCEIFRLAVVAAQWLVLLAIAPIGRAQTADPANPPLEEPVAANAAPAVNPNQGAEPTGGGQLPSVVVTGYLIPRVGEGPQPVTTYDQSYIQKTGYQNVTDVLQNLLLQQAILTRCYHWLQFFTRFSVHRAQRSSAK